MGKPHHHPYLGFANVGVWCNAMSGRAAQRRGLPGTARPDAARGYTSGIGVVSFPGGNTTILRMTLARMSPGVIAGRGSLVSLASAPIDFAKLDRAGSPLRIRVDSTAIQIVHEGDPASAEHVLVTYAREGKLRTVRARSVVMASGGWVNRTIVSDLSDSCRRAYGAFHYGPVRSEEHTSEIQSLMRISYAVFCLKKKNKNTQQEPQKHAVRKGLYNTHK